MPLLYDPLEQMDGEQVSATAARALRQLGYNPADYGYTMMKIDLNGIYVDLVAQVSKPTVCLLVMIEAATSHE